MINRSSRADAPPLKRQPTPPGTSRANTRRAPEPVLEEREEGRDELEGERFWQPALAILIVGIVLRQLWLAAFPYHPDEAIHGWYPLDLTGYKPNPVYHGPVMYILTAFTYALFSGLSKWLHLGIPGDNDYTARLPPSLLGIALLAILLFGPLRKWMGTRAVLWAAALLAISPSIVTYSRRALHDALVLVLTLGVLILFQQARESRAWSERGYHKWLGLSALMFAFLATKANVFFILALLVAFWVATWVQARIEKSPSLQDFRDGVAARLAWLPMFLFALVTVAAGFALRVPGEDEISMATTERNERLLTICVILCAGLLWLWVALAPRSAILDASTSGVLPEPEELELSAKEKKTRTWRTSVMSAWCGVLVFAWFSGHGYLWWKVPVEMVSQPAAWAQKARVSFTQLRNAATGQPFESEPLEEAALGPKYGRRLKLPSNWNSGKLVPAQAEIIAQTGGGQDWDDITMSVPRMVKYWSGQQKKPRLPGRHDYFATLIILYELPIVLAAVGGIWHASRRRTHWGDLLLWWAFLSWALYAMANEKVPWLLVHMILPFSLLAGWWLSHLWSTWSARATDEKSARGEVVALGALCALGAVFLLRNTWATNFERAGINREPMFYAQTSDDFHDQMMASLKATQGAPGGVWMHGEKQWPGAWYFRAHSPLLPKGTPIGYGTPEPDPSTTRILITTPEDWAARKGKPEWKGWKSTETAHYIWPRASWPSLRLDRWMLWWATRQATPVEEKAKAHAEWQKSILQPPGEWSNSSAVFATPPKP